MQAVVAAAVPIVMSAAPAEEGGEVGFFDDMIWKWIVCSSFSVLSIYEIYHVCFHHEEEDTGFFMGAGSYYFQCPLYLVMITAEWLHFCHIALELITGDGSDKHDMVDMYNDKKSWSEEELAEWEAASDEEKEAWKAEGRMFGSEEKEALDVAPFPEATAPEADAANKSFMQRHAN